MKPFRSFLLYGGIDEYILDVRLAFDANDFGFQVAGMAGYIRAVIPLVFGIVIWLGECVAHAQDVGAEVVRYALQYTVRDALSECEYDATESHCMDCGLNELGSVCSKDIEENASQICKNVTRVGTNGLQVVVGEG